MATRKDLALEAFLPPTKATSPIPIVPNGRM